jgi:hypothetical protein
MKNLRERRNKNLRKVTRRKNFSPKAFYMIELSPRDFYNFILSESSSICVLDLRANPTFLSSHIINAINLDVPSVLSQNKLSSPASLPTIIRSNFDMEHNFSHAVEITSTLFAVIGFSEVSFSTEFFFYVFTAFPWFYIGF